MNKHLCIPLIVAFGSMAALYIVGTLSDISMLSIKTGEYFLEIPLLPVVIGLTFGFITEFVIRKRKKRIKKKD